MTNNRRKSYDLEPFDPRPRQLRPVGVFSNLRIERALRQERYEAAIAVQRVALHETASAIIDQCQKHGERLRIQTNIAHENAIKEQRAESLKISNDSAKVVTDITISRAIDITESDRRMQDYIDQSDMADRCKDFHRSFSDHWHAKLHALNNEIADEHFESVKANSKKIFNGCKD